MKPERTKKNDTPWPKFTSAKRTGTPHSPRRCWITIAAAAKKRSEVRGPMLCLPPVVDVLGAAVVTRNPGSRRDPRASALDQALAGHLAGHGQAEQLEQRRREIGQAAIAQVTPLRVARDPVDRHRVGRVRGVRAARRGI